jgi:hypothetical protein
MKLEHHSPSSLNMFPVSPAMYVLERMLGLKQPVGAPAHRGTAVEAGVAQGLLDPDAKIEDCVETAFQVYDTRMAMCVDARREKYRKGIPGMVQAATQELRGYGIPSSTQGLITWHPEDLIYPIIGYYDFKWDQHGLIIDLKTSEKMPTQIKFAHARQVALYASSDNMDARLTYVTPNKMSTFQLENIREHRDALHQIARNVEAWLSESDDIDHFLKTTAPDLDSYMWNGPEVRQLAYAYWRI